MRGGCKRCGLSLKYDMNRRSSATVPGPWDQQNTCAPACMTVTYRIVEISRSDRLLHRCDVVGVGIRLYDNFYSLAKTCELIPDVSRSVETLVLEELLIAKLLRVIRLRPLFPDVQ